MQVCAILTINVKEFADPSGRAFYNDCELICYLVHRFNREQKYIFYRYIFLIYHFFNFFFTFAPAVTTKQQFFDELKR